MREGSQGARHPEWPEVTVLQTEGRAKGSRVPDPDHSTSWNRASQLHLKMQRAHPPPPALMGHSFLFLWPQHLTSREPSLESGHNAVGITQTGRPTSTASPLLAEAGPRSSAHVCSRNSVSGLGGNPAAGLQAEPRAVRGDRCEK